MDAVIRGLAIYAFLMVIFRFAGKRALQNTTTFDFVLLLIIAETTQQALLGDDFSLTNACLLITTLITTDILLSLLKSKFPRLALWIDDAPVVLVENGRLKHERLTKERLDCDDIMVAAREQHGLDTFDQIEHAILEQDGKVSIVPRRSSTQP